MANYYCPYCSINYQLEAGTSNKKMVCKYCGDELLRVAFFKPLQIFALIFVMIFVTPLLIQIFIFFQKKNEPTQPRLSPIALRRISAVFSRSFEIK